MRQERFADVKGAIHVNELKAGFRLSRKLRHLGGTIADEGPIFALKRFTKDRSNCTG